ncbi:hypothetical protein [Nocardioides sp. GXQ0305]|uniref:hypothetical protein n=1 Tax=Nocardioides sp. GXQ0305 TaxID=3423912 RepID=UPI003D7DC050
MRRAAVVLLLALGLLWPTSAVADDVVVVPGTSFPAGATYLSWFGCAGLYGPAASGPSATVGKDDAAPLGSRATRLAMPATGQATGPVTRVDDVAAATLSMWVRPQSGGLGVAHVWYVSAELDEGEVWAGRADLTATAGEWQQVRPSAATYRWTRLEAATGQVLERHGEATLARFTRAHGSGPGYLLAGFGCDGSRFQLDGVGAGSTTFDLEGFPVTTSIEASQGQVAPGAEVTLTGRTLDSAGVATGAALVLEARPAGAPGFSPVREQPFAGGVDGAVVVTVTPDRTTDYRWFRPTTGYADAGRSPVTTVRVGP